MTALERHQVRRFTSPLRYPGGKGKVANFMRLLMLENNLVGAEYVEPYAGGASVALALLFEDFADHIHINDVDPAVHAFWHVALTRPDELCDRIRRTRLTVHEWHRQRDVQAQGDPDELDLAFSTFFLNRTNRSGIITGGIIGGLDQTGQWKLDARFNREDLIRRVQKVGRYAGRITLTCQDAVEFLQPWRERDSPRALVYLDPPYYAKGQELYRSFYEPDDHAEVAQLVRRLTQPWIVSYDAGPAIFDLYRGQQSVRYSISYSAASRTLGSEVMFFAPDLVVPDVENPARVSARSVDECLLGPS